jgi:hypothetical protein
MNLIYTSKNFIRTLILASFVILPTTVYADRGVNLAFGRLTTQSSTYSQSIFTAISAIVNNDLVNGINGTQVNPPPSILIIIGVSSASITNYSLCR